MEEPTAIQEGLTDDRQAFGMLVERYYKSVYRLAYHYAGNHQDADDVCQQTFLIALEQIGGLRDRERFEGWILVIASNLLRRKVRQAIRGRRRLQEGGHERRPGTGEDPVAAVRDSLAENERAQAVRMALQRMPEKTRLAAILVLMEGRSQKEAAAILRSSQASVCRHVEAARNMLQANLRNLIE